jgi:hypothetical protein
MPIIILIILGFLGWTYLGDDSSKYGYDSGYSDGYAVGYNSICYPKSSNLIHGDWSNKPYTKGYNSGHSDGVYECKNK